MTLRDADVLRANTGLSDTAAATNDEVDRPLVVPSVVDVAVQAEIERSDVHPGRAADVSDGDVAEEDVPGAVRRRIANGERWRGHRAAAGGPHPRQP